MDGSDESALAVSSAEVLTSHDVLSLILPQLGLRDLLLLQAMQAAREQSSRPRLGARRH